MNTTDYYPTISQAVRKLPRNTTVTRQRVYDLARSALASQLRSLTPALSESEIEQEALALDAAIRRVELESLRRRLYGSSYRLPLKAPQHIISLSQASDQPRARPASPIEMHGLDGYRSPKLLTEDSEEGDAVDKEEIDSAAPLPVRRPSNTRAWLKMIALVIGLGLLGLAGFEVGGLTSPFVGTPQQSALIPEEDRSSLTKLISGITSAPSLSDGYTNTSMASKVVLYEEDEKEPAGKQFSGRAIWRMDLEPTSPGHAPVAVIRADIEIPNRHLDMHWSLRSNDDQTLAASHIVEIEFTPRPDFPHLGVAKVPGLLMKQSDAASGSPLTGFGVNVTDNFFVIALSTADVDMQRNIELLKDQSRLDILVLFADGRRAIISIQKGDPGTRAFSQAFALWQQ